MTFRFKDLLKPPAEEKTSPPRLAIEIIILFSTIATFILFMFFVPPNIGCVHWEIDVRLPHYLSPDKSLPQKVFDVNNTDSGTRRTRVLSYLFDLLDCRFISYSFNHGFPHFFSLTYLLLIIALALMYYRFSRNAASNTFLASLALLLLFLSTPCIFLTTSFFRTAKIGVSVCIFIILTLLYGKIKSVIAARARGENGSGVDWRFSVWCLAFALASCLFDEQGFFLVLSSLILVLLFAWLHKCRDIAIVCGGPLFISALLYTAWFVKISHSLTHALLGYYPPPPVQEVLLRTAFTADALQNAFMILVHTVRFFFGNLTVRKAIALLVGINILLFLVLKPKGKTFSAIAPALCIPIAGLSLVIGMLAFMVANHPPVLWPDILRSYYWIPLTTVMLFIAAALLGSARRKWPSLYLILSLMLMAFACRNMLSLGRHATVVKSGHMAPYHHRTRYIVESLKQGYDRKSGRYTVSGAVMDSIQSSATFNFLWKAKAVRDSINQRNMR